jgi:hypothetical protein
MNLEAFRKLIDARVTKDVQSILGTVPFAGHLIEDEQVLDEAYYVRHRIETVKRIRMTAKIDALALASLIDIDYEAARKWSHYISQELNHDVLFMKDLEKHGCTEKAYWSR